MTRKYEYSLEPSYPAIVRRCLKETTLNAEGIIDVFVYGRAILADIAALEKTAEGASRYAFAWCEHRAEYTQEDAEALCAWLNERDNGAYPLQRREPYHALVSYPCNS
jgi:hypothetical protein